MSESYILPEIAIEITKKAPCSEQVLKVINKEITFGNVIKAVDKVSMQVDETYYIILFQNHSKEDYPNMKTMEKKDNTQYEVIVFANNFGCTEIRFGY